MKRFPFLIAIVAGLLLASAARAQTINLSITNLESSDGQVILGIYKDQASFDKEKAAIVKEFYKGSNVKNGTLQVSFSLTPGVWGITLLDDTNYDSKMNYNWIGMPKEGFGFSNNYHTGFSKPKFSSFSFNIAQGQTLSVTVKVRYI